MQLNDWLRANDIRLDIRFSCDLDPAHHETEWRCEISGYPDPTETRPAVYLHVRHDPITATAGNPEDAYRDAVHKLRGVKVGVISREVERDETLRFPDDVTV